MLHFPSKLPSSSTSNQNGVPRRFDSLNATQQRSTSNANPIFLRIEEELHDARRVQADGQEDDLRSALSMVINRVSELSALLSEAYRVQADLEVQLNVAKSNLQLVIANNEMLEDALKRDTSIQAKDVGWRRSSARESRESVDGAVKNPRSSLERSQSADYSPVPSTAASDPSPPPSASTTHAPSPPAPAPGPTASTSQEGRFFKFRFSSSTSTSASNSRPATPTTSPHIPNQQPSLAHGHHPHLTSPSMPSLTPSNAKLKEKEIEDLTAALEKERAAKKLIAQQKAALEDELESLSQALFEEANKMVADERKARAETEEELKELRQEKEALRSALRLIDGEIQNVRSAGSAGNSTGSSAQVSPVPPSQKIVDADANANAAANVDGDAELDVEVPSRSSSRMAIKSRPESLDLSFTYPPLPPSPAPDVDDYYYSGAHEPEHPATSSSSSSSTLSTSTPSNSNSNSNLSLPSISADADAEAEEEAQPTPRFRLMHMPPRSAGVGGVTSPDTELVMGSSAWADVPSRA